MIVHQVVSATALYQIQKKFNILKKFLLRKSYLHTMKKFISLFLLRIAKIALSMLYFIELI